MVRTTTIGSPGDTMMRWRRATSPRIRSTSVSSGLASEGKGCRKFSINVLLETVEPGFRHDGKLCRGGGLDILEGIAPAHHRLYVLAECRLFGERVVRDADHRGDARR